MTLTKKAILGLLCLMFLAACGANATPAAPTETATLEPTATTAPTETPQPTETPTVPPPAGDAAATPLTTLPTVASGAQPPAAGAGAATAAPAAGGAQPAAGAATAGAPGTGGSTGIVGAGPAADKYTYLGQDITDGTQFLPNRTVTVTWTIQNTGTTGWTKDYTLRYFAGPKPEKDFYNFTKDTPANDKINFTVTFTTPSDPGDYDLWFKLTNAAGQNFGDLDLRFTVSNNPQKLTPTTAPAP